MTKKLNLGVIGIDHGHIFDMLDEMLKEGCSCNYFWTEGNPLTLEEFNKKYPNIKRKENKEEILNDSSRQNKNIKLPIVKDNPLYNSWLPK